MVIRDRKDSLEVDREAALWRSFFVICSGRTNGAHQAVVAQLKSVGQTEAMFPAESDYLLVFCPIASRVGTDVSEALEEVTVDKPIILVVMHHTFNAERPVVGSSRLVADRRVRLTVDYLFYQDKLLSCQQNRDAMQKINSLLGLSSSWDSGWDLSDAFLWGWNWICSRKKIIVPSILFSTILLMYFYWLKS